MPTQVMFYIFPEEDLSQSSSQSELTTRSNKKHDNLDGDKSSVFYQACLQASYFYRQGQRVFIYTKDTHSAETIDDMLWAFEPDSFVPHNLAGEGPKQGSAVEISHQPIKGRRSVLINLTSTVPNFANQFNYIVDFVPAKASLKQQARERFKTYRQWGFHVDNQPIAQIKLEKTN